MSLKDDVYQALYDAGVQLSADLWKQEDKVMLAQRANDLIGLKMKYDAAEDEGKRGQYQLAADMIIQHVQMVALTRLHVAQQHLVDALLKFFLQVLLPNLIKLLPGLILAA